MSLVSGNPRRNPAFLERFHHEKFRTKCMICHEGTKINFKKYYAKVLDMAG